MDRRMAHEAFVRYVSDYDADNPRIALKIDHTMRVARLCDRIAEGIGLGAGDIELAWMVGLLHDIGRFEQVRRYNTFNDAVSVGHARLGAQVLFEEAGDDGRPRIRSFVDDPATDDLIRTAIETHSDLVLPNGLDARTRTICQVLRDADKIDILKVNCICPIEDIYGVTDEQMRTSQLSPACIDRFYQHRCLPRDIRNHPADIMLGHICFAWELVYPTSIAIAREQGHLDQMLSRSWSLPATQEAFTAMGAHLCEALGM